MGKKNTVEKKTPNHQTQDVDLEKAYPKWSALTSQPIQFGDYKCTDIERQKETLNLSFAFLQNAKFSYDDRCSLRLLFL